MDEFLLSKKIEIAKKVVKLYRLLGDLEEELESAKRVLGSFKMKGDRENQTNEIVNHVEVRCFSGISFKVRLVDFETVEFLYKKIERQRDEVNAEICKLILITR